MDWAVVVRLDLAVGAVAHAVCDAVSQVRVIVVVDLIIVVVIPVRIIGNNWNSVIPVVVGLVIPVVVIIIPVVVPWRCLSTVGILWEIAVVSSCIPVLTSWTTEFEGKTGVTFEEMFTVGRM